MTGRILTGQSPLPSPALAGRRALLTAAAGAVAGGAAWAAMPRRALAQSVPPAGQFVFNIMRHGSRIGEESLTFHHDGDRLTVFLEVSIRVTVAMIPVYRLYHHDTETWQGGQLLSFAATTVKNGTSYYAQCWRQGDSLMARGSARPVAYAVPGNALPTSQWNHAMLNGPMINTQDGRLMHPLVTDEGMTEVQLADGSEVQARHFNASGDLHFDTFFNDGWEWVGLSFHAPDGSVVTYERA